MDRNLPEEIIEARRLFEKYEKSQDHEMRTTFYIDAMDLLKGYQEANPESPHNKLVDNLRKTYLRKIIQEMPAAPADTIGEWYDYVAGVMATNIEALNAVLDENPELTENLESYMEIYRDDFSKLIEKRHKNKKPETRTDEKDEHGEPGKAETSGPNLGGEKA